MKTVLHRYGAWLRKEWRDQRAILTGIALAIPGLTALAYWAFGENLVGARLVNVQTTFLAIAIGMVVFAVAGDLLAGENRRGTIHALRRLPGGMGSAFAAKVTLLVLAILVAIVLQGLSLAVAEHVSRDVAAGITGTASGHPEHGARPIAVFDGLAAFPTSTLWLTGLGFGVFGLWTLLVSSWMGRSGVAGLGAAVLLAALATPFVLLLREHPWYVPGPKRLALVAAGVGSLVALAGVALSFLRGQRFAGRPFRPVLLGLALLLVAVGGGYAYARQDIDRWISFGPDAEDLHIHGAAIGADGRHLYLTVARGAVWHAGRLHAQGRSAPGDPWGARRGTPAQAWIVDLADGAWRAVDERAPRYFRQVPEAEFASRRPTLDPVEALVCYRLGDGERASFGWFDARTGAEGRILPFLVRDATALDLVRRQLHATSWVRDAQGRRVWLRDGVIEREGDALSRPAVPVARSLEDQELVWMQQVPGGWFGYARAEGGFRPTMLDATTGERTVFPARPRVGLLQPGVLSTTHMLVTETIVAPERGQRANTTRRRVMAIADPGTLLAPVNEPPMIGIAVARDLVFALRGPQDARTLHLWNPRTGADRPLRWRGDAPEAIRAAHVHGRTGDGRVLLQVWRNRAGGPGEHGYAVIDADLATAQMILPMQWRHTGLSGGKGRGLEVIALMPDDSLVLLEGGRRVVRARAGGALEVLFPRP